MWHQFFCWSPQKQPKMHWMLDNNFVVVDTPYKQPLYIDFQIKLPKNFIAIFFAYSKGMANNQTSQYELLNKKNYVSRLDILQYVRVIFTSKLLVHIGCNLSYFYNLTCFGNTLNQINFFSFFPKVTAMTQFQIESRGVVQSVTK